MVGMGWGASKALDEVTVPDINKEEEEEEKIRTDPMRRILSLGGPISLLIHDAPDPPSFPSSQMGHLKITPIP